MTTYASRSRLRKFLQITLLTFAVFSNVGLVWADARSDKSAQDITKQLQSPPPPTVTPGQPAADPAQAAPASKPSVPVANAATLAKKPAAKAPTPAPAQSTPPKEKSTAELQAEADAAAQSREGYAKYNVGILQADGQSQGYFKNAKGETSANPVASFILQIINFITVTAGSLSFLGVVAGGFLMMSSAGNTNQITKGKDILTNALIGLTITLTAYFIVAFVQSLLFETIK